MDEIKNMLKNIQNELIQQKIEMQDIKEDIKTTINDNMNEKFKNFETKYDILEKKLEFQSKSISNFEKFIRRKNLLFFGVQENENSYHDLEKNVLDIINNKIKIECENNSIEFVRRLGKKSNKIRPIVVTFLTMGLKIKILKNKKRLETTSYYIKEDFPIEILNKRKELQIELRKEIEKGRKGFLRYDKLIILKDNTNNQKEERKNNKKRNLSESPEVYIGYNMDRPQNKKQPTKFNKTNNMNNYILKKPTSSHSENSPTQ